LKNESFRKSVENGSFTTFLNLDLTTGRQGYRQVNRGGPKEFL